MRHTSTAIFASILALSTLASTGCVLTNDFSVFRTEGDDRPDGAVDCPAGEVSCGGTCIRTVADLNNCGRCGIVCTAESNATPACTLGVCRAQCDPGFGDCNGMPEDGCEAALDTAERCGSCTNACRTSATTTSVCEAGMCVVTCAAGFPDVCTVAGVDTCVNTLTDPAHCGGCGIPCAAGQTCDNGMCPFVWAGVRTFSSCGQTGNTGPTNDQCTTAYTGTTLAGEVFVAAGIQQWTVPGTGTYRIEARGAQGGTAGEGSGAIIAGTFALNAGTVLHILVGQPGGGGGGGSFVVRSDGTPLLVAGGGGSGVTGTPPWPESGGRATENGGNGCLNSVSLANAGTAGGAGGSNATYSYGGGGGFTGTAAGVEGGRAYVEGGQGGTGTTPGGFGGGGANRGGGGGYSGGGCGGNGSGTRVGGGGGSFNSGTSPMATESANAGPGQVTINLL